jgi:hypothetical protein
MVSTGVNNILNKAAIVEADKVLIETLRSLVKLLLFSNSKVSLFEKVSPNQERGPCNKATEYPL